MEYAVSTLATNGLTLVSSVTYNILQKTYEMTKSFVTQHHTHINEVVEEYDLYHRLELIGSMMKEVQKKQNFVFQETIHLTVVKINEVLQDINQVIERIAKKITDHQEKYFHTWRTLNYDKEIKKLKQLITLLNQRYQLFLNLLI
jgi:ATP-dependent RNA circularization protein (DNA/RNA ligase family)